MQTSSAPSSTLMPGPCYILLYILTPHSSQHWPAVTSRWTGFAVDTMSSALMKAWSRLHWQQTHLLKTSTTIIEPFGSHGREVEDAEGKTFLENPQLHTARGMVSF